MSIWKSFYYQNELHPIYIHYLQVVVFIFYKTFYKNKVLKCTFHYKNKIKIKEPFNI
jgi:hypothetical protein